MAIVLVGATTGQDYSALDSREKAWDAVEREEVVALAMIPGLFGGDETNEANIIFVPEAVADRKDRIDEEVVLPMVQAGKAVEYSVTPTYSGRCMVPTVLDIKVSDALSPEATFYRLQIWAGLGG